MIIARTFSEATRIGSYFCNGELRKLDWQEVPTGFSAQARSGHSYVWREEYEIFEFDLGSTFNYAEMPALIARPFMVERGPFDGIAPDETGL